MKRIRLWVISLAIKRIPQLAVTLVQLVAAKVALEGIISESAEAMMWEHITAALVIVLTGTVQWIGSKWAGDAIGETQRALGVLDDELPDIETKKAAVIAQRTTHRPADPFTPNTTKFPPKRKSGNPSKAR